MSLLFPSLIRSSSVARISLSVLAYRTINAAIILLAIKGSSSKKNQQAESESETETESTRQAPLSLDLREQKEEIESLFDMLLSC